MLLEDLTRREKLICRKYWHDYEDTSINTAVRLLVNKHIHHHILGDRARHNYRRPSTYIRNCGDAQQKRELHTDGLG